jgi:hypothetical protein
MEQIEIERPINEILEYVQQCLRSGDFKQNKWGIFIKNNLIEVSTINDEVSVRIRCNMPELAKDFGYYKARQRKLELLKELEQLDEQYPEL